MPVVVIEHESDALRNNPLGDPYKRRLHLVVSEGVRATEHVPCVWYLAGYAGVSRGMLSDDPWQEGIEQRLNRLEREGRIGPMIVALPDAFTKYGGSQYISSSAHGDYETYLVEELREAVERTYEVSSHAVAGKSSGGFGALALAMRHPGKFSAVASHSGDMGFKLAYTSELPSLMRAVDEYGGLEAFVRAFEEAHKKKTGKWIAPMSVLAMAAAYSPDPKAELGVALPFNLETGDVDDAVFERWLGWDPVRLIDDSAHQEALKALEMLFIDCGRRDEYHLQWGARGFSKKLRDLAIAHEYEEFDDGHRGTGYRLDVSLPKIYAALTSG